jgi:membrane-associated phospholipid phosphatase
MTALRRWLLALLLTAVAVAVCYLWLDRPLALLVHAHSAQRETFARLTYLPDLLIPLAAAAFVAFGLWALAGRTLSKIVMAGALCSISLIVAETIKSQLKFACGRLWPETWVQNNPSFIHDGAYGFNLFHGGAGYAAFPSGHTAATCAVISVLWIMVPKWRPLYALVVLAVAVGLIGANYHFLSDVIAGGFVGTSTGWMTVALWQARQSRGIPPQAGEGEEKAPAPPPQASRTPRIPAAGAAWEHSEPNAARRVIEAPRSLVQKHVGRKEMPCVPSPSRRHRRVATNAVANYGSS